jgi:uncharacterized membrane protein
MSNIEARGSKSSDSTDWNRAWEAVAKLAAARGATLPKAAEAPPAAVVPPAERTPPPAAPAPAVNPPPAAPVAPNQLARDIAEIEQAAAALRRAEPSLEPRLPGTPSRTELRNVRSVWFLIALIWLSAASVVSCAIGAMFFLFG